MKWKLSVSIFVICLVSQIKCNDECQNQNDKEQIVLKYDEILNDQSQDTQSDERFVAVHVDQLGVDELDTNSPQILDIVKPFLPPKYRLSFAVNATRQIVNGVKYTIIFVMENESGDESYCEMDVLEKPWMIRNSKKHRVLTYNNCSLTNPTDEPDKTHYQNEINPVFVNQQAEMSEYDLKSMEDQIVGAIPVTTTPTSTEPDTYEEEGEGITLAPLDPSSKNLLDDFFNMNNFFPHSQMSTTTTSTLPPLLNDNLAALDELFGIKKVDKSQAEPRIDESSSDDDSQQREQKLANVDTKPQVVNQNLKQLEIEIKKVFSELFQTDPDFQRNIVALINRKDDLEAKKNYDFVIGVLASKLKDKIEALSERRESQNDDVQVTVNPMSRKRKRACDNQSKCTKPRDRLVGGIEPTTSDNDDVKLFLKEALDEINAGEDPDYSVKEVFEASTQTVAGILVRFKARLLVGDEEVICKFKVWEQAWLPNGRDVKVSCDNQKEYTLTQNPVFQREKARTKRDTPPAPGSPQEIGKDDADAIKLLNDHLSRIDTGSASDFELVSVEKITKQVVAGLTYKVTGSFRAGADDPKNCIVEIWTRPWIKGPDGTQIKADCDGTKLKAKRTKRSLRPMPGRHEKFHSHSHETSELKARELKTDILFENFIKKYHRRYSNDLEHKMRLRIFKKNLHKIDMLNKHEAGTAKYGITPFSDYTEKEYLHKTGLVLRNVENEVRNPIAEIPDIEDLPETFDWSEKGAVTDVKNQGNCGSCWSFSVTGNIEGLHAIKTGKLEAYSEQELLDCDTTDNACNGGYMDDAFKAIEKIGGLELEDEYPYKAKKQKKCMFNTTLSTTVKVKGVVDMPKGDEAAMQKYLVANGPISIGINAAAMQFYRGGVSHPWKILCRKSDLDHGVLLVGYGIKSYPLFNKTLPYWKIKNSWGPKWGEQGYYRIYRGDNSCGVAEMASSAVLE